MEGDTHTKSVAVILASGVGERFGRPPRPRAAAPPRPRWAYTGRAAAGGANRDALSAYV